MGFGTHIYSIMYVYKPTRRPRPPGALDSGQLHPQPESGILFIYIIFLLLLYIFFLIRITLPPPRCAI